MSDSLSRGPRPVLRLMVVVLLRDPAERAVSHFHMERARGAERRPFWLALLLEGFLLARDRDPRRQGSPTRERGYRARGLYDRQLENLYRHLPMDHVLVVRQADLLAEHHATLRRMFAFLGADAAVHVPPARVFAGGPRPRHRLAKALLRVVVPGRREASAPSRRAVVSGVRRELRPRDVRREDAARLAEVMSFALAACAVQWRRGRDSNPRWTFAHTHFPGVLLRPLGHLSKCAPRQSEADWR